MCQIMCDWDIVKKYISDKGYSPQNIDLTGLIAIIILSWEGMQEDTGDEWELFDYLDTFVANDLQSFDYE